MFRKMRRNKQQITENECKSILKNEWRGVLSLLGDNNYPYGVPLNFYYDENEHKIYFHCAKEGHKIDAINRHDKASFTVYDSGYKSENHWSLNITSVIAFGRISIVTDTDTARAKITKLAEKYYPDKSEVSAEISKHFDNALCLSLTIEHLSGKLINES